MNIKKLVELLLSLVSALFVLDICLAYAISKRETDEYQQELKRLARSKREILNSFGPPCSDDDDILKDTYGDRDRDLPKRETRENKLTRKKRGILKIKSCFGSKLFQSTDDSDYSDEESDKIDDNNSPNDNALPPLTEELAKIEKDKVRGRKSKKAMKIRF